MNNHTKVIGILALIFMFVCAGALGGSLFVISHLAGALYDQQVENATIETHEAELDALLRLVEETAEEREELDAYVLAEEDVVTFLSLLGTLGREQGVLLETKSIKSNDVGGVFEELSIETTMQGSYDSVLYTLALLESLPYQSRLESVALAEGNGVWQSTLTLYVTKHKHEL